MTKYEIKEYLKSNLTIEENTEFFGFNGECVSIKLTLEGECIGEITLNIKEDDG